MSEEISTVKGEISEYVDELTKTRHSLVNYQVGIPTDSVAFSEAQVVVIAIDGLQKKLEVPGLSENVDLDTIVKLSDDVRNVKTSASRILAKKPHRI